MKLIRYRTIAEFFIHILLELTSIRTNTSTSAKVIQMYLFFQWADTGIGSNAMSRLLALISGNETNDDGGNESSNIGYVVSDVGEFISVLVGCGDGKAGNYVIIIVRWW